MARRQTVTPRLRFGYQSLESQHYFRRGLRFELLEDRALLSVAPSRGSISPAWFQSVNQFLTNHEQAPASLPDAPTQIEWNGQAVDVQSSEWIVQLSGASLAGIASVSDATALFAGSGISVVRGLGQAGQLLVRTTSSDLSATEAWLAGSPAIEYFEPNFVAELTQLPNDPSFSQLWGLHNTGQTGGTPDADIDAPEAWDLATGSANIVVGVIDTGVDYTHPDLAANMWTNPGEIAGNLLDDDNNGFIDDVHGYDFVNNDGDPMDDHRHGTHVSGTIAGVGNNGQGVAGVNWSSSIMALKFLSAGGSGSTANAVRAVNYATMMRSLYGVNVRLTSNSWGGGGHSQALYDAIAASGAAGMLFVAAAGNSSRNTDVTPNYPSGYDLDNVIAVAATDHRDQLAGFSNYGAISVDLAAPGVAVYSTVRGGGYDSFSGTSMATPHIAGVLALAWSTAPEATPEQLRDALFAGVDAIPAVAGKTVTGGRLNARGTLHQLGMNVANSSPAAGAILSTQPTDFTLDFTHDYDPATLQASDLTVNGVPAGSASAVDGNTVVFGFNVSPVIIEGPQVMEIAPGAILRLSDADAIAAWSRTFYYDTLTLAVVSTTPAQGTTLVAPPGQIILDFNEALDPASVEPTDLVLSYGTITAATALDGDSISFTVSDIVREGVTSFTLKTGALLDIHGTPGPEYSGSFSVDDPLVTRFVSTDVPKVVPDEQSTTSTLTISSPVTIVDVEVELTLLHPRGSDMDLFLTSPEGRRIELFTDVGDDEPNFINTVLDDEAFVSIATGEAPFTGRFRPEGLLSVVDGSNALGTWTLELSDDRYQRVGTLSGWALVVSTETEINPRITSIAPLPLDDGDVWTPISSLAVRFSEVMDAATVNDVANWRLIEAGPDGAFGGADDVAWPLSVSPPYADGIVANLAVDGGVMPVGSYRLVGVSGGLRDASGAPLDGNSDSAGGDDFVRDFNVQPHVTSTPFVEDFEAGSLSALGGYWEFVVPPPGQIVVGATRGGPHSGAYHLQMEQVQPDTGPQYAILHLDLVGRSGLALDFWEDGSINGGVQISPNGTDWHEVVDFFDTRSLAPYVHHAIDLDAKVAAAGFSYTRDFQIRFSHGRHAAVTGEYFIVLDDIRVSQLDVFGPGVLSHSPSSQVSGPINSFTVTFDEPIDTATFLVADVTITGPLGETIALAGHPVDSGDHRTFTINLAFPQALAGNYSFRIDADVRDLAGNLLNQDGDTVAGEADDDAYLGAFQVGPPAAQTVPYLQDFESGDLGALAGWSFAVTGGAVIELTTTDGPHSGAYHIKFDQPVSASSFATQQAVLRLDLANQAGRTDLALDFWLQAVTLFGTNNIDLHVSGDGLSYVAVPQGLNLAPSDDDEYTHYAFDLDAALVGAGIAFDSDVYLRFTHQGSGSISEMTLDDVRIGNFDFVGPRVLTHAPVDQGPGPISQVVVTFSEPIEGATFTASDVAITGPLGNSVALAGDPQDVGDRRTFIIDLARTQSLAGNYSFQIGPDVRDLAGNQMNQDGDQALGETNGQDRYSGAFQLTPVVAQTVPYVQDFESADIGTLAGWDITVTGNSSIRVTSEDSPHGGAYHLRFGVGASGIREAVLLLDLTEQAGRTDLSLDFWLKSLESLDDNHYVALHVSRDGVNYTPVLQGASLTTPGGRQYTHYAFDLDAALSAAGVGFDGDVYLRIKHMGGFSDRMTLDDLRVSNADVFGSKLLSHAPTGQVLGPIGSISVTFDEPIDGASFTAADVTVTGPSGATVALSGDPIDSGDHRTFTINLAAAQGLIGNYSIRVSQDVRDPAGNPMNQDGDPIAGETNGQDGYTGTFEIGPLAAQAFPYEQGFESGDVGTLSGWKFQVAGGNSVRVTSGNSPHGGSYHLKFDQAGAGTQQAILLLDLSQQVGRSDLSLDFWLQAVDFTGVNNFLDVHVSGDGVNYALIPEGGLLVPSDEHQYLHYVFDFDAALSAAGIATDGDNYLQFTHTGSSIIHDMLLDDIRIGTVDVHGPKVVSHLPSGQASLPLSSLSVTFDEEIDPATFTAVDVSIIGPAGNVVMPAGDPVDSGDSRTFMIPLGMGAALAGNYSLQIGPDVRNLAGHAMNQDSDPALGETNGQDSYLGTFRLGPPAGRSVPYLEGFESGEIDLLSGWGFEVTAGTLIDVVPSGAHSGSYQMLFDPEVQSGPTTQSAIVALDLAAHAGSQELWVDFWLKQAFFYSNGDITVHASGDGVSYVPISGALRPTPDRYEHYAVDLDAALATAGVALDSDVYLMLRHSATSSLHGMRLDDLRITDGPINQPPTLTAVNTLSGGLEDHLQFITYEALAAAANEADPEGSPLGFLIESVSSGTLTKNGVPIVPRTTLLSAGEELVWTPGQNVSGSAVNAFLVRAWDGELDSVTPVMVTMAITSVNDPPSFRVYSDVIVDEDSSTIFGRTVFDRIEPGASNESSQVVTFLVSNDNPALFSMQPIVNSIGRVTFQPAPNAYGTATVTAVLRDNGGTENGGADTSPPQTFVITVRPVNDAPLLDNSGQMSLESTTGGYSADSGTLVSAIIASAGGDRITDVDGEALEGIAVTVVDNTHGRWQFSIDNGGNWTEFGAPSASTARLLAADDSTRVRFVPYVGLQGTVNAEMTFRAWDRIGTAANGGTASTMTSGGITPFSIATETATIIVYPYGVQVIDDGDAAGFALAGDWVTGSGQGIGRNNGASLAFGESFLPTDSATWTFDLVAGPGRYRVLATWFTNPDFPDLFSDQARFEVSDALTSAVRGTALVDQKQLPNDLTDAGSVWEALGEFDIVGSSLLVQLSSTGDDQTYVVADAIRVERIADLSPAAEVQVTAGGETGFDVPDGTGAVSFGTTDFTRAVTKTFTISNTGTQLLVLSGPVSVTGNVFEIVAQPALSTLAPGQNTTFEVRMNAMTPGDHTATVSFLNSDGNEELFDFTVSGRVLSTRIIDDSDPGFSMSPAPGDPGGWGTIGGPGREFDYKFNRNLPGVDEFVTWTFNVTPGVYRVSTTWPFGFAGYDEAAPYTIFDGTVAGGIVRGGRNINQKLDPAGSDYPPGSMFPTGTASATTWGRIDVVQITGDTLTVLLEADDAVEFVLADSILIDRLGDIPAGPEIVVVESNRHAAGGTIDYGTTQLNYSLDKTFTITNSGTSVLNITSPINITGPNAAAFQLVSGPNSTEIAPGGTSTFVVRLTAAYEGTKSATISFTTDDSDEGTVNLDITANVLNYRIIDDQDASEGYSEVEMTEAPSGISYQGDVSFANSSLVQPAASATWTFHNMSPGIYYIALTWFDTGGSPEFYSSNTPVTVMDGATVEGSFSVNQKVAPSSFMFEGVSWLILGFFDFSESTVTVTMTNANTNGVILADAVIIARVGGDVPAGNSEPAEGVGSLFQAARASSETIEDAFVRPEKDSRPLSLTSSEALDQALLGTIYWNDDLEDMAAVLAESSTVDNSHTTIPAGGVSELEQNELELVLDDWLE